MKTLVLIVIILFSSNLVTAQSLISEQKKYANVRQAYENRKEAAEALLAKCGLTFSNTELFIRIFKHEDRLELWVRKRGTLDAYRLVKAYPICAKSGKPGPKRRQGDKQVPEGFYHISYMNPASWFDLSMKVDYPNASDKILGAKGKLGNDIYIHGACVTIGCIPLQDEIFELYLFVLEAKAAGQSKIPVHIFPYQFTDPPSIQNQFQQFKTFWDNLKEGYNWFETHKTLPAISVDSNGKYLFP